MELIVVAGRREQINQHFDRRLRTTRFVTWNWHGWYSCHFPSIFPSIYRFGNHISWFFIGFLFNSITETLFIWNLRKKLSRKTILYLRWKFQTFSPVFFRHRFLLRYSRFTYHIKYLSNYFYLYVNKKIQREKKNKIKWEKGWSIKGLIIFLNNILNITWFKNILFEIFQNIHKLSL